MSSKLDARPLLQQRHNSALPTRPTKNVNFAELDDDASLSSAYDSASSTTKKKRGSPRQKTVFSLGYPPPSGSKKNKKDVRKGTLLQLQKVTRVSRHVPAFDLVRLSSISHWAPKKVAKSLVARNKLSMDDFALVRAEDYSRAEETGPDQTLTREVPAVISRPCNSSSVTKTGNILLNNRTEWTSAVLANGSYEFAHENEDGSIMKVRWVLRRPQTSRSNSASDENRPRVSGTGNSSLFTHAALQSLQSSKQFNFSIISQHSRRHPVIAHLTSSILDIQDAYSLPPPSYSTSTMLPGEDESLSPDLVETSEETRLLITATAVWIALREGWVPGYRLPAPKSEIQRAIKEPKAAKQQRPHTAPATSGEEVRPDLENPAQQLQVAVKTFAFSRVWRKALHKSFP